MLNNQVKPEFIFEEEPVDLIDLIDELDLQELQRYLNSLFQNSFDVKIFITEFVSGKFQLSGTTLWQELFQLFLGKAQQFFPYLIVIFSIVFLYGIVTRFKYGLLNGATDSVLYYVCFLSILSVVFSILVQMIGEATACVLSLQKQMNLLFPLILTLMAASGGAVSAAVYQPSVAFLSTQIVSVVSDVVFVIASVCIIFTILSHVSKEINMDGFHRFFSHCNQWIMGICFTIFGIFLTIQGVTAGIQDGISLRAAKYAISNSVPIIGGFLSSGFDMVVAGSVLIRNTIGVLGVFLIFFVVIQPIAELVLFHLFLQFLAAFSDCIGENKFSDFFQGIAKDVNFFIAGLLGVAFLFFITIFLLVCSFQVL